MDYIKEINLLATQEIETIRVYTSDSYVEEDLTPEESLKIQKSKYLLN